VSLNLTLRYFYISWFVKRLLRNRKEVVTEVQYHHISEESRQ